MTKEYVQMVGRMAYMWGWPLVDAANRAIASSKVPEPGLLGGVFPVAYGRIAMLTGYVRPDQTFVTCTNQDVVYGVGYVALDKEPIVFQVPDFGDRFWVFAHYDARTDETYPRRSAAFFRPDVRNLGLQTPPECPGSSGSCRKS
jgi:hypothetical protein